MVRIYTPPNATATADAMRIVQQTCQLEYSAVGGAPQVLCKTSLIEVNRVTGEQTRRGARTRHYKAGSNQDLEEVFERYSADEPLEGPTS